MKFEKFYFCPFLKENCCARGSSYHNLVAKGKGFTRQRFSNIFGCTAKRDVGLYKNQTLKVKFKVGVIEKLRSWRPRRC